MKYRIKQHKQRYCIQSKRWYGWRFIYDIDPTTPNKFSRIGFNNYQDAQQFVSVLQTL